MPAKSQEEAGFMGLVASGKIKKKGLTPAKAKEFLRGVKVSKLPIRVGAKKNGNGNKNGSQKRSPRRR